MLLFALKGPNPPEGRSPNVCNCDEQNNRRATRFGLSSCACWISEILFIKMLLRARMDGGIKPTADADMCRDRAG